MPQPSSRRYLKAQLRPLANPVFWASASLFGLSLVALVSLFTEPNKTLSGGDRNAVVNLDNNESLTPEERARAAEIDDLSVLLKDLDKRGTIDSVSGRLNEQQAAKLETPKAIENIDNSIKPAASIAASQSEFQQLPLLDLNPQQPVNNLTGQASSNSGFVGFDPRSSGQVGGISTTSTTAITPLAAALDRNNVLSEGINSNSSNNDLSNQSEAGNISSNNAAASTTGSPTPLSNEISNRDTTYPSPNLATPNLSTPNYGSPQSLTPQNSSDNAYSQILNPNLVIPTAPVSPALPNLAPIAPVAPAIPSSNTNLVPGLPRSTVNGGAIAPFESSPQSQSPTFGAPTANTSPPPLTNPAPFSVPNTTPNQASGNGKINTFANP